MCAYTTDLIKGKVPDFGGAYSFGYFQLFSYVLISDLIPCLIYKPVGIES